MAMDNVWNLLGMNSSANERNITEPNALFPETFWETGFGILLAGGLVLHENKFARNRFPFDLSKKVCLPIYVAIWEL